MKLKMATKRIFMVCTALLMVLYVSCNSQIPSHNDEQVKSEIETPKLKFTSGVRSILEDRNGNIWFGSYNEGVCLLHEGNMHYFTTQNGLSDNQVRSMYEDQNGNIWLECGMGLSMYKDGKMTVVSERNISTKPLKLTNTDLWFKSDSPVGNTKHEKKSGVYQYDGNAFYYHTFAIKDVSGQEIPWAKSTGFVRSKNGTIWFGAYSELIGYDGKQFVAYNNASVGLNGTTENLHIRSLLEDSQGNLWIGNNCGGGRSGIGVIKYDGKNFTHFTKQHRLRTEDTKGNSLDKVFSIAEDHSGNIWFGTNESGAWRYDGQSVRNFTPKDGLDSGIIWIIYPSKNGELWFGGGPNGVYRFNGKSFERKF